MKNLVTATLIAMAALTFAGGSALADDDDDNECKINMAKVDGGSLVLMGRNLTRKDRQPIVFLAGVEWTVDFASSDVIEASSPNGDLEPKSYEITIFRKGKMNRDGVGYRKLRYPCHPFEVAVVPVSASPVRIFPSASAVLAPGGIENTVSATITCPAGGRITACHGGCDIQPSFGTDVLTRAYSRRLSFRTDGLDEFCFTNCARKGAANSLIALVEASCAR